MAVELLIDTNIFLEISLQQNREALCRKFLDDHVGQIAMSDFTLHSIGIGLFRRKKYQEYGVFIRDVLPLTDVLSLPDEHLDSILKFHQNFGLDYDDSCQASIAKAFGLTIVTIDEDFRRPGLPPVIYI
ncbi:MAG TPA: PIN domain-containing protein [Candidatus Kapabacteria bacterium]|nr:PIN domain-containing protein [Candidatus Kapabacteria bacterium]